MTWPRTTAPAGETKNSTRAAVSLGLVQRVSGKRRPWGCQNSAFSTPVGQPLNQPPGFGWPPVVVAVEWRVSPGLEGDVTVTGLFEQAAHGSFGHPVVTFQPHAEDRRPRSVDEAIAVERTELKCAGTRRGRPLHHERLRLASSEPDHVARKVPHCPRQNSAELDHRPHLVGRKARPIAPVRPSTRNGDGRVDVWNVRCRHEG